MGKPVVKLNFTDFGSEEYLEVVKSDFLSEIEKFAEISISENPDFLVCGAHGQNHLYYNCVKILYCTEENEPDFNYYDYAIGYNELYFYDRFLNFPFYIRENYRKRTKACLEKHIKTDEEYLSKTKFCNFIYSNGQADKFREDAFHALNAYKHVDSAGKFLNNMGNDQIAGDRYKGDWAAAKREFIKGYKFTMAFANCQKPGYADEKIFDAWMAGTVPIFWGDSTFDETFNPKSYIDCTKCKTTDEVVEKVKEIEESPEKYLAMQKEPIVLPNSKFYDFYNNQNILSDFFKQIMLSDPSDAKRTTNGIYNNTRKKDLIVCNKLKRNIIYKIYKKLIR